MPARHEQDADCSAVASSASCKVLACMHSTRITVALRKPAPWNWNLHVPNVNKNCLKEATAGRQSDGWKSPRSTMNID